MLGLWILFWMRWNLLEDLKLRSGLIWSLWPSWAVPARYNCGEGCPQKCLESWHPRHRRVSVRWSRGQCTQEGGCEPLGAGRLPLAAPDPPPYCEPWEVALCEPVTRFPHPLVPPLVSASGETSESGRREESDIGVTPPHFLPVKSPLAPESLNRRFQLQSSGSPSYCLLPGSVNIPSLQPGRPAVVRAPLVMSPGYCTTS